MPTFDFFNVIRAAARVAVKAIFNRVTAQIALFAAIVSPLYAFYSFWHDLSFFEQWERISLASFHGDSEWRQFVSYIFHLDYAFALAKWMCVFFRDVAPLVVGIFTTCGAAMFVYRVSQSWAREVKEQFAGA